MGVQVGIWQLRDCQSTSEALSDVFATICGTVQDFIFYSPRLRINKRILSLCMGNHELYMRRRKPDSIEVQQMKAQAREEKAHKHAERAHLFREKQAREHAEGARQDLEDRLRRFEIDAQKAMMALASSEAQARELEQKVAQVQQEVIKQEQMRLAVESARKQAEATARQLADAHNVTAAERDALKRAAADAEARATQMSAAAASKSDEAARMQQEAMRLEQQLLQARREEVANAQALMTATQQPQQAAIFGAGAAGGASPGGAMASTSPEDESREDSVTLSPTGRDGSPVKAELMRSEESRSVNADRSAKMRAALASLGAELDSMRDSSKLTRLDMLHAGNVAGGKNKFKTLPAS